MVIVKDGLYLKVSRLNSLQGSWVENREEAYQFTETEAQLIFAQFREMGISVSIE